jgi:uncharacterized protein
LRRILIASCFLAVAAIGDAPAGQLEDDARLNAGVAGVSAMQRGDYAMATRLLRPLAEHGNSVAQDMLGTMIGLGLGAPQDYAKAAIWLRLAADQGNASAQLSLGVLYKDGDGVPQDYTLAHMWLNLAATRASNAAIRERAARNRAGLMTKMTPGQVAEAQRMAREWVPK